MLRFLPCMPIVSVSLTDKNIEVLDNIQDSLGLAGRSEAIRVCLRSADTEARDRKSLVGKVEGVLIIVHDSHRAPGLDDTRHAYQELISTQIHSHLANNKCLEVFIIQGKGDDVKELLSRFQRDDKLEYVKFVQS